MQSTLLSKNQTEVLNAVRELREKKGGPVRTGEVREKTGKGDSHTSDLLGELVDENELVKLKRGVYDLPEYVEGDEGSDPRFMSIDEGKDEESVSVPLLSMRISAGDGAPDFEEQISRYVSYDRNQIQRETGADPSQLAMLPVTGTSMEPTLTAGDRVLVIQHNGEPLQDGAIYVFRNERRGTIVKRLWWEDSETVRLESDNDDGPTIMIDYSDDGEEWRVLGRVVRVEKHL